MTTSDQSPSVISDGALRIRVQFNANQDPMVEEIKNLYAELSDRLDTLRNIKLATEGKSEKWKGRTAREFAMAQTELESSAHWAIKGITAHFQD